MTARVAPGRQRVRLGKGMRRVTMVAIALVILTVVGLPIYWLLATAVRTSDQVIADPLGIPSGLALDNFVNAWTDGHFGTYFVNSVVVAAPTVFAVLVLSTLAGYAMAAFEFRGKAGVFALFIIGLTIPIGVLVIPLFYEMKNLGLLDTAPALILPQVALYLPFGVLLMRGYIQELPSEILDAARVDGCTDWSLLTRIVAPLSRPALLSLLVLTFMWTWNQFILAVVLTQTDSSRTLPIGLRACGRILSFGAAVGDR